MRTTFLRRPPCFAPPTAVLLTFVAAQIWPLPSGAAATTPTRQAKPARRLPLHTSHSVRPRKSLCSGSQSATRQPGTRVTAKARAAKTPLHQTQTARLVQVVAASPTAPPIALQSASVSVAVATAPQAQPPLTPTELQDLEQALIKAVNNPAITIKVLPQKREGKNIVVVSGRAKQEDREAVERVMSNFARDLIAYPIYNIQDPDAPTAVATQVWPLTFVDNPPGGDNATIEQYAVDPIVSALNAIYGDKDHQPVTKVRNALVLRGSEKTLHQIKRQLVQLDAPGPQVQLDMWAIQISGKRGPELDRKLQEMTEDVRQTQDVLKLVPTLLVMKDGDFNASAGSMEAALGYLDKLGFDRNPERHLSLNEKIIFMGLANGATRKRIFTDAITPFQSETPPPHGPGQVDRLRQVWELWDANRKFLRAQGIEPHAFPRLTQAFSADADEVQRDQLAIEQFVESAYYFTHPPTAKSTDDSGRTLSEEALSQAKEAGSPTQLRLRAATADALFKLVMDSFTADVQEMFMVPLLKRLLDAQKNGSIRGVSLVGRTRLVVTSGLQTSLTPDLASYIETTRPAPLTKGILDLAFPRTVSGSSATEEKTTSTTDTNTPANGTTTGTTTVTNTASDVADKLTGLASVMAKLPASQAIALAAALNPPTPTFSKIAPGIGINVRPSVLPDGGAARLQVNMQVGVETTEFAGNDKAERVLRYPPSDSIKSHKVSTDAIVSAFDLFDISSFDISTSTPRPPGYVPVLGTLPLIGKAFQWRRKDTQLDHHSLILVNTVILPRAMNLAQFYSSPDS